MIYVSNYNSPIGKILLAAKDNKLIGLWVENQKYYLSNFKEEIKKNDNIEILEKSKKWLARYFKGENPNRSELEIELIGTDFRKKVWKIVMEIPYGTVTTYKEIAERIKREENLEKMSGRAVGQAIGHNPILIIVPCHRVIGTNGNLTGYAAGIEKKIKLLQLEQKIKKKKKHSRNIG